MSRGNVCVTGKYEGLYYIDNEDFHVYRKDDSDAEEPETCPAALLSRLPKIYARAGAWMSGTIAAEEFN